MCVCVRVCVCVALGPCMWRTRCVWVCVALGVCECACERVCVSVCAWARAFGVWARGRGAGFDCLPSVLRSAGCVWVTGCGPPPVRLRVCLCVLRVAAGD